jgi:transposase
MNAFRGMLGIKVVQCRPGDPEAKGLVERANGYLETSFLPGRSFSSPADFNAQLADWLTIANARNHRGLGCRPIDRWGTDTASMLALPPTAPATGWASAVRLGRDHYVRVDSNDYSLHPSVIGRKVAIRADLETVRVHCDGLLVADHQRCWADHQTLTDPGHTHAATMMRARRGLIASESADALVACRDLADYDRVFATDAEAAS